MQTALSYLKSVVIAGDTYTIRPVQKEDFDVDLTHCKKIPDVTEASVNFGLKPDTSKLNLFGIYDIDDARSSGFIAAKVISAEEETKRAVGFGLYAKNRESYSHEFYISVDHSLKGSSLPKELLGMIVQHAKSSGINVLFCHSDESNSAMQELAKHSGMLTTLEPNKAHGVKYTLMVNNYTA